MIFKNKELIIFDFDGTLINSIPDITSAVNKMLAHFELSLLSDEEVTPFIGNGPRVLVTRTLEYHEQIKDISPELLEESLSVFTEAYKSAPCEKTFMYPNVLPTLEYLYQKGFKMAICTNKPYHFIEPILDKLAIKKFFIIWIGEDSLEKKKPDALPLLHLAAVTNSAVENCIMVGDSKNDIIAAHNAGIESIGVSYGYNYNENIADYKPTIIVDDFQAIQNLL